MCRTQKADGCVYGSAAVEEEKPLAPCLVVGKLGQAFQIFGVRATDGFDTIGA